MLMAPTGLVFLQHGRGEQGSNARQDRSLATRIGSTAELPEGAFAKASSIWTARFVATARPKFLSRTWVNELMQPRFDVGRRRAVHGNGHGKPSPSRKYIVPNLASQMRVAFSSIAWNTAPARRVTR